MLNERDDFLRLMAGKYLWWKTPEEALTMPDRIIAQVMNLGTFDDVEQLAALFGDERLGEVLTRAEPGVFDERSWAYWHYRLGLAEPEKLPPMPVRTFA